MANKVEKYYVRFSGSADYQKIMDFYHDNKHKNVRKRDQDLLKTSVENGSVTLIEDEKGNIVASSISYPIYVTDKDGIERVKWHEFGSTRIVLNGYDGMFEVLVTAQALRAFLVEPPEERFVAQMHYEVIQDMAKDIGWRKFGASQELLDAKAKTVDASTVNQMTKDNWFQIGLEGMPTMAETMVKFLDQPCLENPKTGKKITLDFSKTEIFSMFEQDIRKLAKTNKGDPDNPDLSKGVADHHRQWRHKRFK